MRILDGLVARTFIRLFVLACLSTPPLFILGELTEDLDDFLDAGLSTLQIAQGYLFKLPQFFTWSFPIAGLIASVFTVHGMTSHMEVMAAKAGGISFYRLYRPVFLLGILVTVLAGVLSEYVPQANRRAAEILDQRRIEREWKSDFAFVSENGYTVAVGRLTLLDERMTQVALTREQEDGGQIHITADGAAYEDGRWVLRDGSYRHIPEPGREYAATFNYMRLAGLTETPEDLIQSVQEPEEMTREQILRRARIAERAGAETHQLFLELHTRLALALATIVIIIFGVPLATSSKRGGAAFGIGLALGSTMLYISLFKVFEGLGESGAIPVEWAAWTPNGIFLLTGVLLLSRVRT